MAVQLTPEELESCRILPERIEASEVERLRQYILLLEADRERDQVRLADQAALLIRLGSSYQAARGQIDNLKRLLDLSL